jgi:signal transduction histidine kinase
MPRSRLFRALIWPSALVLLMAVLAFFQYKWLGQVSEAEDSRMRRTLHQRAYEFADDFDRELGRAYQTLQIDNDTLASSNWEVFARRVDSWQTAAKFPQMLRNIYIAQSEPASPSLLKFDPASRTFAPAEWPAGLASVRSRFATFSQHLGGASLPGLSGAVRFISMTPSPVLTDVPAILIPVQNRPPHMAEVSTIREEERRTVEAEAVMKQMMEAAARNAVTIRVGTAYVIAELDRDVIVNTVLPALVERHFPAGEYRLEVSDPRTPERTVFSSNLAAGSTIDVKSADAAVPLFSVRPDATTRDVMTFRAATGSSLGFARGSATVTTTRPPTPAPSAGTSGQFSVLIDQRMSPGAAEQATQVARAALAAGGGWQLKLQHPAGSLKTAVTRTRAKNLALSFGVLALLAVSVFLITINAQRAERLAAQQMDFVATVSHELRTPLAVIRSAAQNLSAGVIDEPAKAKRYGDLIDSEGRRLTDMVEQVLEYAGLSGARRKIAVTPTDVVELTKDVLDSHQTLFVPAGDFTFDLKVSDNVPLVPIDDGAVRRALNNLIGNALKYGGEGQWLGVTVETGTGRSGSEVRISVADKGPGIDTADLPHIFDAFYRGRDAKDRQIHGNGLGLSLVKRIAEAHGGRVSVKSSPGAGATFTLHLPV